MNTYKAPWSTSLILVSSVVTAISVFVAVTLVSHGRAFGALVPVVLIVGCLLFTIRGYTITPDAVLVHRLCWSTRVPLAGLASAEFAPDIMRRSIRLWGNGGLFSFAGWFRNKALGVYRSFVTDPHRTVLLRFAKRPVLVSPSAPEKFVQNVLSRAKAI